MMYLRLLFFTLAIAIPSCPTYDSRKLVEACSKGTQELPWGGVTWKLRQTGPGPNCQYLSNLWQLVIVDVPTGNVQFIPN